MVIPRSHELLVFFNAFLVCWRQTVIPRSHDLLVFFNALLVLWRRTLIPGSHDLLVFFQCTCGFLTCLADAVCNSDSRPRVPIDLAFCLRRMLKSRLDEEL